MNSYERIKRMYEHKEADRIPIIDDPWQGTIRRWHREGMPEGVDWRDYFDVDKMETIGIDISPRMPVKVLEDTDRYYIATSPWGRDHEALQGGGLHAGIPRFHRGGRGQLAEGQGAHDPG